MQVLSFQIITLMYGMCGVEADDCFDIILLLFVRLFRYYYRARSSFLRTIGTISYFLQ
jgi:hypothetical protein